MSELLESKAMCSLGRAVEENKMLRAEIARLRAALKVIDECFADMKTRLEEHLWPLPPGPEGVS